MKNNLEFDIFESTEKESTFIDDKLVEFNSQCVPFTQKTNPLHLNYVLKTTQGIIAGGINSVMYHWGILYIDVLWIDTPFRGRGYGIQLLNQVEKKAKENNCTLIHLDTYDFQAKDFYLKQGYEIFGILEDCPPGHKLYHLKKVL